jgi:hypothetical protein
VLFLAFVTIDIAEDVVYRIWDVGNEYRSLEIVLMVEVIAFLILAVTLY